MKNISQIRVVLLALFLSAFSILPSWAIIGPYCQSDISLLDSGPIVQMSFVQTGTNDYVIVITSSTYRITAVNGYAHISSDNTYHYGAAGRYSISDDGSTATIPFTSTTAPKLYNNLYVSFETIGERRTGIFNENDISWSTPASCSYSPETPCDEKHFYFVNAAGWSNPKAYMWKGGDDNTWPGVAITELATDVSSIIGGLIYEVSYDGNDYDHVIFSDDGANQTADLSISNCNFYLNGTAYSTIEEIEAHFVFFVNTPEWTNANVRAHIWKNGGSDMHTWNDAAEQMTVTSTTTNDDHKIHYYYVSNPSSYDKIIFHDNGNTNTQSANLDLEYGHYFNYVDNCWYTSTKYLNFSNGGWSLTPFTWSDYSKTIQTASVTISNDAVNYEFNIKGDGSSYYYNHGTMAENNCTDWKFNENSSSNCWINPDVPGDYIFNYDFAENKLSVIYPPYMLTASYVSATANSITLSVTSTRGTHYHVVDATHGIDLDLTPTAGQIVVTGLTANTAYTFTITALDGNDTESANNISVTAATTPNVNAMPSGFDDCQITAVHTSGDEYSPLGMNLANWSYAAGGAAYTDGSNKKAYKVNTNATYYAGLYFGSAWVGTPTTLCDASNATKLHVEFFSPTTETFNFDVLSYYNSANHDGTAQSVTATAGVWQVKDFDLSLFGGEITGHKDVLSGFKIDYGSGNTGKEMYIANVYFYKDDAPCTVKANREDLDDCRVLSVLGTTKYDPMGISEVRWSPATGGAVTIDDKGSNNVWRGTSTADETAFHLATESNIQSYNKIHLEIWTGEAMTIQFGQLCWVNGFNRDAGGAAYQKQTITTEAAQWKSLDYTLTDLTTYAYMEKACDLCFYGLGGNDIYITNVYYYNDDATKPLVASATNSGISGTDLTLTLTATYKGAALNTFRITNTTTSEVYDRTADGSNQVTIPDIDYCTAYTLNIQAIYNNCILSDPTVMNIAAREPTSVNLASLAGVTATAGKEALAASYAVDADATTRWGSEGGSATQHWITVDLQKRFSISTIKLSWETACSKNYYLKASLDGTHFYPVGHYTTAPSTGGSGASVYTTYAIESGVEARYLQMYSLENNTGYGTSIWEFEAYGACASNGTIPIMTFADVHNISLSNSGATVALEVGAWDDATAFDDLTYKVVYIAGKSETLNNQAATDGVLSLSSLTIGTTYTVRIYAIDGSGNESANYKEVTFTPYVNLYYFTNDLTGTDPAVGWADALNNASNAAARRFSTTAQDGIYRFSIAVPADYIQYRLYYDESGQQVSEVAAYWSHSDNQIIGAHSGETNEVYAKDKNHFVSIFDELKVYGAAVGAATEGAALTMTYNGDHTFSWEGDVASGTNAFRIIVNNNHSTITDNSRSRIMDAAADFVNSSSWTRAKLTFDMTTWTWTWEEATDPTQCSADGGPGSGMTIAGDAHATTFTDGYTLSVKKGAPGHLLVSASIKENVRTDGAVYLNFHSQSGSRAIYAETCIIGAGESTMSVTNKDVTIPAAVASDPVLALSVKFEIIGTGIAGEVRFTDIMYYNLEDGGCVDPTTDFFDIYHWDDAPIDARTSFGGGNIVLPIRYFRHFDNNWTTITVPFEVEKVVVYDEDDKVEYPLFPRFYNGTQDVEGYYYLKTFDNWSTTSVALKDFQASWKQLTVATDYDGLTAGGAIDDAEEVWLSENVKPAKNTPYSIKFPYADYYATNWVIFYGSAFQTIASDFNGGTSITLTNDNYDYDQVKLQCNNTMHPTPALTNIYMIEEGRDLFTRRESQSVPAFEAYVIGTSQVQARFSVLRWSEETTDIKSERPTTADDAGEIYTVSGMRLATFANQEQMERYLNTFASGVYVVRVGTRINKVIVH